MRQFSPLSAEDKRMTRECGHVGLTFLLRRGDYAGTDEMKTSFILVTFRRGPRHVDDDEGTEENDDCEREENEAHGNGRVPESYAKMVCLPIRSPPHCGRGIPVVGLGINPRPPFPRSVQHFRRREFEGNYLEWPPRFFHRIKASIKRERRALGQLRDEIRIGADRG